jgi:hypothetical protein
LKPARQSQRRAATEQRRYGIQRAEGCSAIGAAEGRAHEIERLSTVGPTVYYIAPMKINLRTLSILVVTSALSCGGGGATALSSDGGGGDTASSTGGGSCGQVQPCGGAVVWTWKLSNTCFLDSSFLGVDATSICPTAMLAVTKFSGTGGITYGR